MWLIFQSAVMIAVGWTGIYYEWTPNRVALGILMVGAAWVATRLVSAFLSWCRGTELARADRVTVILQRLHLRRPGCAAAAAFELTGDRPVDIARILCDIC